MTRPTRKNAEQASRSPAVNEAINPISKPATPSQEGGEGKEISSPPFKSNLQPATKEQIEMTTRVNDQYGYYAEAQADIFGGDRPSDINKSRRSSAAKKVNTNQITRPAGRSSLASSPPFSPGLSTGRKSPQQFLARGPLEATFEENSLLPMDGGYGGMMAPPHFKNTPRRNATLGSFPPEENSLSYHRSESPSVSSSRGMAASQMPGRPFQPSPNFGRAPSSRPRRNRLDHRFDEMDDDSNDEGDDEYLPQQPQRSHKSGGGGHDSQAPRKHNNFAAYPESDAESSSAPLFVSDNDSMVAKSSRSYRISKRSSGKDDVRDRIPYFTHDSYLNLPRNRSPHPARRQSPGTSRRKSPHPARHQSSRSTRRQSPENSRQRSPANSVNQIGRGLDASRHSDSPMPWVVNNEPEMTYADEISEASLAKRNLKLGDGNKVCKRGYGANDPENIAIVNMKEKEGMGFQAIADALNKRRVKDGRQPTLSFCGIAGRYNRTAPLLFKSEGKIFVPLAERRSEEGRLRHGRSVNSPIPSPDPNAPRREVERHMRNEDWNGGLDMILVNCYKAYDKDRWNALAQIFTEQTGIMVTPEQISLRHSIL